MFSSLRTDYNSVIVGASGGIGAAIADAIEADPRSGKTLRLSRRTNPSVDFNDAETLDQAAEWAKSELIEVDALIVATGVLISPNGQEPEKAFSHLSAPTMEDIFRVNTIGPALTLKAFMPMLARGRKTVVATLSARVGSIGDNGLGGWITYRASKSALNQITHTAAIELSRKRPESVCVALHPGTIETDLSRPLARGKFTHTTYECAANLIGVLDKLSPEESGGFFDYSGEEIVW